MTIAVCVACGALKHGAFNPCDACGKTPQSEVDLAYSLAMTDHHFRIETLAEISRSMLGGRPRPTFPPDQEERLRREARRIMPKQARMTGRSAGPSPETDDGPTADTGPSSTAEVDGEERAVCFACGRFKQGPFRPCPGCGVRPSTEIDLAYSFAFSDAVLADELEKISEALKSGAKVLLKETYEADLLKLIRDKREKFTRMLGFPPEPGEPPKR